MAAPRMMSPAQQGMDDERTARMPQEADPDERMFAMLTGGLRRHIFGKGEAGIVEQMRNADDPGRVMGEITFVLVREAATQAQQKGHELAYEVLIGVATEVIDDITELMQAQGMQIDDRMKEYALMYAQQLYVENHQPSEDERNSAKQELAEAHQSGDMDQAVSYIQQRGMEAGADPFGVNEMGAGMMERGDG